MSLSCTVSDILLLIFENWKTSWPRLCKGQFVIPMLNHHMANQCTKFEVSSFSHSGDILGGTKNLNGSRDHNHATFRASLWSVGWNYSYVRSTCLPNLNSLYVHPLRRYQRWRKMQKLGWFGELGVTQGHQQHNHSIECTWLPIWL